MSIDSARRRADGLPVVVTGARAPGWWGMALVVVTELALFGSLLAAYVYLRFLSPTWPPAGDEPPNLLMGGIATVVLLASSYPVWRAERALRRGDVRGSIVGFLVALALAAIFLGIQGFEYVTSDLSWRTDAYGSLFFTITGFHAAHLIVGMLLALGIVVRAGRRDLDAEHTLPVEVVSLYWHFVDGVWIAIFVTLYLTVVLS